MHASACTYIHARARVRVHTHTHYMQAATLGSQESAFENVQLKFSGDQDQVMRNLISSSAIHRVAMCALFSTHGQWQHLVVNHDK